jgi:hypothetical protein
MFFITGIIILKIIVALILHFKKHHDRAFSQGSYFYCNLNSPTASDFSGATDGGKTCCPKQGILFFEKITGAGRSHLPSPALLS